MSHPNKVSVIFKKKDKEDTTGYLRLSYRQDNKTKLISIKMLSAIPEKYGPDFTIYLKKFQYFPWQWF